MSRKNWGALACAAFVGAAVAFPAGVIFGGHEAVGRKTNSATQRDNASEGSNFRNIYSPRIYGDPYVQDQWRKEVEPLEAQCRDAREHCAEAKAARRWFNERH